MNQATRKRYPIVYALALFALAALLAAAGGGQSGAPLAPAAASAGSPLALPQLTGSWSGTWTDTLYAVSGAVTLVIWNEGSGYAANGTIDVTGISGMLGVLGGGATGVDNGVTLDVQFDCTDLGGGTVVLTPDGGGGATAAGSGNVMSPLNFGPFTLTGTASDTEIVGSFDFTSPGGGKGIAQFTKVSLPVEEQAWGSVKAAYYGR